jgi:hypothetical protein
VLDYCKTVNFNRNARRMQFIHNLNVLHKPASSQHLPDEIDGDERGTVLVQKTNHVATRAEAPDAFAVDQSMFIEEGFS